MRLFVVVFTNLLIFTGIGHSNEQLNSEIIWKKLLNQNNYQAVIFKNEIGKYSFDVTPQNQDKLKTIIIMKNGKSLYERLGGASGIEKIVDDLVEAHANNPAISKRYIHMVEDPERMAKVKKHTRQFLGAGTGGPETYEGEDMPAAHKGMNISEGEFLHVIDDILATLDKNNIDPASRNEVLAIAYSLKDQVVRL